MKRSIDLNADLAESNAASPSVDELALLDLITSANVACGFHAGCPALMQATCRAASERGVKVGAQVSYQDREGFGRRDLDVPTDKLRADVLYQLQALCAFGQVVYVKPHGALYNRAAWDERQAQAIVEAVMEHDKRLPVLGLPDSTLLKLAAEAGLSTVAEGFVDRRYTAEGLLVSRSQPGAVITDPETVVHQAIQLAGSGRVQTLCVHGDTPGALELARRVRQGLQDAGYLLAAFT